jgi:aspartate aminotransferase
MPPDHGGAVVASILTDKELRSSWESELTAMRNRMLELRQQLTKVLRDKTNSRQWDFIADHRGMFSTLVLNQQQTDRLLEDHAIYTVAGGRINIAGFTDGTQINRFADALIEVTS